MSQSRRSVVRRALDPLAVASTLLVSLAGVSGGQLDTLLAAPALAGPVEAVVVGIGTAEDRDGGAVLAMQARALGLLID